MTLTDDINAELDGRKMAELVGYGRISPNDVLHAPVEHWNITCNCPIEPTWPDCDDNGVCKGCGGQWERQG